ncbi:MAG: antibiotic biosynthesis monooxygenase [Thermoprotei archaeon]
MISIGLYYDVIPGKESEFEEVFNTVKSSLEGSEGFVSAILYRRVDKPNSYLIYSEWRSLEDFRAFIRSRAFKQVTSDGKSILERTPYNRVYQPLNVSVEG